MLQLNSSSVQTFGGLLPCRASPETVVVGIEGDEVWEAGQGCWESPPQDTD